MSTETTENVNELPLDKAIAEYMRSLDQGEVVDREAFLRDHADISDQLRDFFDASDAVEKMAGPPAGSSEGKTLLSRVDAPGAERDTTDTIAQETCAPARLSRGKSMTLPHEFGRYRLTKLLGEGAMGSVYLAYDSQLDRDVALKMPKFDGDEQPRLIERFSTEAKAAATLSHPGICPIHDVGEHEGRHYLTMAFVDGQPLERYIGPEKLQSPKHLLLLVRKLALALAEAHARGVVHRDLKPSNIMIDKRGEPIIMDFGLARRIGEGEAQQVRATQSGELLGTPAYMSPEQVAAELDNIGPATDVYSLGVIFYELLTGQLPFSGSVGSVLGQILHKEPPDPMKLRPQLDPRIAQVCRRMLAKKIDERYESMSEVAEWLRTLLKSEISGSAEKPQAAAVTSKHKEKKPKSAAPARSKEFTSADAAALVETARACVQHHDYAQAKEVLLKIPGSFRDDDFQKLLKTATDLQQDVDFLIADMEQAVRLKEYEGLKANVKRLLKLKPGYKPAKQLLKELNTYSRGEMKRQESGDERLYHKEDGLLRPIIVSVIGLALLAGAVYAGFTFYLKTTAGTVKVTVYDPSVTISLDEEVLTLTANGVQTTVRMGDHTLLVRQPGLSADVLEFTVDKGDVKVFHVELVEGELAIVEGDRSPTAPDRPAETIEPIAKADSDPSESDMPDPAPSETTDEPVSTEPTLVREFVGHSANLMTLAFSSDGRFVATGALDKTARVWDADTGEQLQLLEGHTNVVHCVRFSPDGTKLLTAAGGKLAGVAIQQGDDNTIRIWDVKTGDELQRMKGHSDWVKVAEFTEDGMHILSGGKDGLAKLWNVETGNDLGWPVRPGGYVKDLALSPDGQFSILGVQSENSIQLCEITTGRVIDRFPDDPAFVNCVAISPDGEHLIVGYVREEKIRMYKLGTGEPVREFTGHESGAISLSFLPDGRHIASTSGDGSLRIWQADSGQQIQQIDIYPSGGMVTDVAFSPNGTMCLTAHLSTARLYRLPGLGESGSFTPMANSDDDPAGIIGNPNAVFLTELPPVDVRAMFGLWFNDVSINGVISEHGILTHVWPTSGFAVYNIDGRCREFRGGVGVNDTAGQPPARDLVFSVVGDENVLWQSRPIRSLGETQDFVVNVTGVRRLELRCDSESDNFAHGAWLEPRLTGTEIRERLVPSAPHVTEFEGHTATVRGVDISADGRFVASGGDDTTVRIWDRETAETLRVLRGHTALIWTIAFDPEGRLLASGGNDGVVRLWDVNTGEQLAELTDHTAGVRRLEFSADGTMLATCSREVIVWDVERRRPKRTFDQVNTPFHGLAMSPDGRFVAYTGDDRKIHVGSVNTGRERASLDLEHIGACVDYSPDGESIICGTSGGTIVIWNMDTQQTHEIEQADAMGLLALAVIPETDRFVTTGSSGMVKIWDLETRNLVRQWYSGSSNWQVACTDEPVVVVGGELGKLASGEFLQQVKIWRPEQAGQ